MEFQKETEEMQRRKVLLAVATDPDEECDDAGAAQIACNYMNELHGYDTPYYYDLSIDFVCVNGTMTGGERKEALMGQLEEGSTDHKRINIHEINTYNPTDHDIIFDEIFILQIAPLEDQEQAKKLYAKLFNVAKGNPHFVLAGSIGTTFNSQGDDATAAAQYLFKKCDMVSTYITDGVPCFQNDTNHKFGEKIQERIEWIAFKNTVFRADPCAFTPHLVGPGGANWKVAREIAKMAGIDFDGINPSDTLQFKEQVTNYFQHCEANCSGHSLLIDDNWWIRVQRNWTPAMRDAYEAGDHGAFPGREESLTNQKGGLHRMMVVFNKLWGIESIMLSSAEEFKDFEVVKNDANNPAHKGFKQFKTSLKNDPKMKSLKMSPAYDPAAMAGTIIAMEEYLDRGDRFPSVMVAEEKTTVEDLFSIYPPELEEMDDVPPPHNLPPILTRGMSAMGN